MSSRSRLRRSLPALVVVLVLGPVAAACGPFGGDDGAEELADHLAGALTKGDVAPVPFSTEGAAAEYAELSAPLKSFARTVEVGDVQTDDDRATATLDWRLERDGVTWEHATEVAMTKEGETWKAVWAPSVLEDSLVEGETLRVSGVKAERGDILGNGDQPLVEPRAVVRFGIDKTRLDGADPATSARVLAAAVDVDAAAFARQVTKAGPKAFVQAIVVRRDDVTQAQLALPDQIKGAVAIADKLPLAPSKDFAAAILGTVGPATAEIIKESEGRLSAGDDAGLSGLQARYDERLGGTPGFTVAAVPAEEDADGLRQPRTLFFKDPTAGEDLRVTLDRRLQTKAQELLRRYGPASALVAVKPSTGEILVAASGPGSDGYNTATFAQYAPGSTFKVVSSLALLRSGMKPSTRVSCPPTTSVTGKQFKNYSDYPSGMTGTITLREAVANSCNTAFITSRDQVTGTALADAAAALGFGVDHDLGFPAYFGQVPAPGGETEAAADLIGQGKVLASPMAMAAVVASVVDGSTVVPVLVKGLPAPAAEPEVPLTGAEAASLRTLMKAVVSDGSGSFLRGLAPPDVLAKTGTAEYGTKPPLPTHAWMVGAQGDLAVAVFVADGESGSRTAGPVLEDFLRAAR